MGTRRIIVGVGFFLASALANRIAAQDTSSPGNHADMLFFEAKIRPVLETHCLKCHSSAKARGGLVLDHREGLRQGGDTGPAIVPGKSTESLLLRALKHDGVKMPPDKRLPDSVIADFAKWIERGAFDPRVKKPAAVVSKNWEDVYQERMRWWSLQPIQKPALPKVRDTKWPRTHVDHFILHRLEAKRLTPAPEAERGTLARRLSFALLGLPPKEKDVERFVADKSPEAYERYVDTLLDSPHFGERWARHWMDVVHYSDTHGYEWDVPAKNAWRYRDYLIRAFNADIPFDRLVLEQIAGDLIEPRIDPATGVNEAAIGPMAMRLGERRHGDSSQVEGVTQEAMANIIDTVSKGFLGTTVACAQCHDHKLDAVAQRDYYALAGVFMSTRWGARSIDATDPNVKTLAEMGRIKNALRAEIAKRWADSRETIIKKIKATKTDGAKGGMPESLQGFWQRLHSMPVTEAEFAKERERRLAANKVNLTLLADFSREDGAAGWRWDGFGMRHGRVREGEFVVAEVGPQALAQLLPAGRWSHAWSSRLAGALQSPLFEDPVDFSVGVAAGSHASKTFIIDQAFHSERMTFPQQPRWGWLTTKAGAFATLEGSLDKMKRRVYLEFATKALNNYYPPRTGYGGVNESDLDVARSWFGVTKIYSHAPGKAALDELARFEPLMKTSGEPAARIAEVLLAAVARWGRDACVAEDALLLDEAVRLGWLPNDAPVGSVLADLVAQYRQAEKMLQLDRTIGSVADWEEGRDERIGIRGSYTELGAETPRGTIRFLGGAEARTNPKASGRLELAKSIASPENPLTARVYVNRVWLHLFGEGLVRTPDDFGHLGEPPVQRELLDYLAWRFMQEGWSTKKLVRLLTTSAVWRQSSTPGAQGLREDPENRLWHYHPMRRLEAEAIRDVLLATSGRLDPQMFGPPIDPYRTAEDKAKRLLKGPLDGNGRRSIYLKMTLMEPPRFLAIFNQPIPMLTVGKRDLTNVPDQALALLNDPFVVALAKHWSEQALRDGKSTVKDRAGAMFAQAVARPPTAEESDRLMRLLARLAELRGVTAEEVLRAQAEWQDFAHALFNMKEFIYVR